MRAVIPGFLFLVGLLTGACCGPQTVVEVARDHQQGASDIAAKTVALVGYDRHEMLRAYCTGVWVSGSRVLTANHCVDDLSLGAEVDYVIRADIDAPAMQMRSATLEATDEGHDLALVHVAAPPLHGTAYISLEPVRAGMFAQTIGMSLGLWYSYSSGDVAGTPTIEVNGLDIKWVQTTTPVSPGNSGGGLFDAYGNLMGICHGGFTRGQMLNLFVHKDYVSAFLQGRAL